MVIKELKGCIDQAVSLDTRLWSLAVKIGPSGKDFSATFIIFELALYSSDKSKRLDCWI